ncbi:thioredoxin [Staphylospora marina]|uniref:thioredoxin n=1 Tax=Staphylospora marina TaxID=2490858 RepID=UPI000F5C1F1F|nr:thioredoxin [Staphylospora marina]
MAILEVTDSTFQAEVQSADAGVVLVDFWAPWCGPCRMLAPVLDEVDAELGDQVKIVKVNVDNNPDSAAKFGIMAVPTLILFKNGEQVAKMNGAVPKEHLISWIKEHL